MKTLAKAILRSGSCISALMLLGTASAWAQESALPQAAEASDDDLIIVTGSRIAQPELNNPSPIVSVTAQNIEQSGLNNLTELLAQSPALFGSLTNFDAAGSQAAFGTAGANLLDLRNLGTKRTLVLVNGRRHIAGVSGEAAVDINSIPVALIDNIDVLTGGVSAIYGADGVSGVVNFVLKRDFEGLDLRAQRGISEYGDAPNTFISATAGQNFASGRGNLAVSYEFRKDGRVGFGDRPNGLPNAERLVRNPDDPSDDPNVFDNVFLRNVGYADSSTDGAIAIDPSLVPIFRGGGGAYDQGRFLPGSGGLAQGGSNTSINAYQGDLQAATETHNANILGSFEFSDALQVFVEGKYVNSKAFTIAQPSFDFFTFVPADNPFIPASIRNALTPGNLADFGLPDGVLVTRDNFDLGTRNERVQRDLLRSVFGLKGAISDNASYEVSYTFGQNKIRFTNENARYEDRYFAALDAVDEGEFRTGTRNGRIVCRADLTGGQINTLNVANLFDSNPLNDFPVLQTFTPGANSGCAPLNVFGENVRSQASLDFINANLVNRVKLTQHVVSGFINGNFGSVFELPGGPIGFAIGGEYRKEQSDYRPDAISTTANAIDPARSVLADLALLGPERGGFDVWEGFAELRVPVLADVPFAHRLDFSAALRLSDYSTIGRTTTWKVDGVYAPIRDVSFRGSYSEAVRAPNITELFAPTTGAFSFLSDPCSPVNINNGTTFRAANCEALISGLGVDFDSFDFDSSPQSSAGLLGRSAGNTGLAEESARTWTAGVVLRPQFIRGLSLSFDWYDIRLKNAINTADLEEAAEFCVDAPTIDNSFCNNITRDTGTGYVINYIVRPENVAFFSTAGADMTISYAFAPEGLGDFNIRGTVGYLDELQFLPANGGIVDNDRGESGSPKWVGTADVTWTNGNFLINYGFNYVGKQRRYEYDETANDPDIVDPAFLFHKQGITHDIRLEWAAAEDKFKFFFGANNFTNEKPGRGSSNTPVGFLGRFFYAGVRLNSDTLGF